MSTAEYKDEIKALAKEVGYIKDLVIVDETTNTIKIRLIVNKFCYIQIYVNFKKDLKNYAVIINRQRVYGRDSDGGKWHIHPWEASNKHEFTKKISLKDFLFEAYKELLKSNIL